MDCRFSFSDCCHAAPCANNFSAVRGDYWVLDIAADYSHALVGQVNATD